MFHTLLKTKVGKYFMDLDEKNMFFVVLVAKTQFMPDMVARFLGRWFKKNWGTPPRIGGGRFSVIKLDFLEILKNRFQKNCSCFID